jgi:hypothetical protein
MGADDNTIKFNYICFLCASAPWPVRHKTLAGGREVFFTRRRQDAKGLDH